MKTNKRRPPRTCHFCGATTGPTYYAWKDVGWLKGRSYCDLRHAEADMQASLKPSPQRKEGHDEYQGSCRSD